MLPAPLIQHQRVADLSAAQVRALWVLWHRVFPRPDRTLEERLAFFVASPMGQLGEVFVIWEGDTPLAVSGIFAREILTPRGALTVQGLAGVCSAPELRGGGLGRAVTRAAFAEVDRGAYPLSLFQTGVPDFYVKLGARLVHNPFVNSRFDPTDPNQSGRGSRDQPWWSPHVMIYPARYDWPEGEIDLLGLGY